MELAFEEITLVLFTTLAPSGAMAFVLSALVLLFFKLRPETSTRFTQFLVLPIFISIVGLIASATHLGSPSNALYAFAGLGRSPLSNEVSAAVAFLTIAGTYWLASFSNRVPRIVERVWLVLGCLSALVFINSIAYAYRATTIVTWDTGYSIASLWLFSLVGGSLLCILNTVSANFLITQKDKGTGQNLVGYYKVLLGISSTSFAISCVVFFMQGGFFAETFNAVGSVLDQFPYYRHFLFAYMICVLAALIFVVVPLARKKDLTLWHVGFSNALVLTGIFLMRFSFYATHMTSGL